MDIQFLNGPNGVLPILLNATSSERRRFRIDRRTLEATFRPRDITGMKVALVALADGTEVRTPFGRKSLARRRAKNKVARQSRKDNR